MPKNNTTLRKIREGIARGDLGGGIRGKVRIEGEEKPIKFTFEAFGACENKKGNFDLYARITQLKYPEDLEDLIEEIASDLILDVVTAKIPRLNRKKIDLNMSYETDIDDIEGLEGEEKVINEIIGVCLKNRLDMIDTALTLKKLLDLIVPMVLNPHDTGSRYLEIEMDNKKEKKEEVYGYL